MKLKKYHYSFFAMASISLVIALIYFNSDTVLDINIHDTYFIIAYSHLALLLSIVLSFIGLIYYLHFKFNSNLNRILSKIHLIGTISIFIILMFDFLFFEINPPNPNFPLFDDLSNQILIYSLCFLVFGVSQVLFLFNSIFSSILHLLKKN